MTYLAQRIHPGPKGKATPIVLPGTQTSPAQVKAAIHSIIFSSPQCLHRVQ